MTSSKRGAFTSAYMAEVEVARYRHEREGALMVGAAHPIRVLESTKYRSEVCVCGGVGTSLGNIRATNCKRGQKLGNILNYKKAVAQVEDWRIVTERDGGGGKYVDVMIRSIL